MVWSPVLHIYQPPTQFPKILRKVAEESYAPLVSLLERNPKAKLTLNINASLAEQLSDCGFDDLLHRLVRLTQRRQIELLGSAAYHPLLTRLPSSEVNRQICLNEEINRQVLGEIYKPQGFFPPELAYSGEVGNVLSELGYEWVLVEGCSSPKQPVRYDRVYEMPDGKLRIFFRHKELSLAIAFGQVGTADEFAALAKKQIEEDEYLIVAMDGETFGHHLKNSFDLLYGLYGQFESLTVSEVLARFPKREKIKPRESTWAATVEECERGEIYPHWDNPDSPLHSKQWELYNLAIEVVEGSKFKVQSEKLDYKGEKLSDNQKKWVKVRRILDRALHSDQFWWASHAPHWHPAMVERGTKMLREAIEDTPDISEKERKRAKKLYDEITTQGVKVYGRKPIIS